MMKRVVITGMGLVTPLGSAVKQLPKTWLPASVASVPLNALIPQSLGCHLGGEVRDFSPMDFISQERSDAWTVCPRW